MGMQEAKPQAATQIYFARQALLPQGIAQNVRIAVADDGTFAEVSANASSEGATRLCGLLLPGMVNLHSHAFQRAMAGLTERGGPATDSFWTWREVMYRFLHSLGPDDIEAIAAQLYVELLRGGFTGVVEFHYLHRDPDGALYANPAELALRIAAAAEQTGIGLTLLASLYQQGGFGAAPITPGQKRFFLDDDTFGQVLSQLLATQRPHHRIGIAPHSLRAVTPQALARATELLVSIDPTAPIHLHISEQPAEVAACLAWSGQTPIDWLIDHVPLDKRYCLIHATHATRAELGRLGATAATVGLCPSTEANLGDGIFAAAEHVLAAGTFGIGTDSHVGTSALDELRLLEYSQRLRQGRRNVLATHEGGSTGVALWQAAARGGAQAAGQPTAEIAPGCRADLVVLDEDRPALWGKTGAEIVDAAMFGPDRDTVSDVMCRGKWVVRGHRHIDEEQVAARFRATVERLAAKGP